MDIGRITQFSSGRELEPLRQIVGTALSPQKFYAAVCPKNSVPNDGEQRLLIRDDAFGQGVLQSDIGFSFPTDFISGRTLADPMDAMLLDQDGYILFIRSGQVKIEKIPGIGNETGNEFDFGSAGKLAIFDGDLWATASQDRIFRRTADSKWALVAPALQ
ncbi:hypothetical protein ACMA5I_10935 [Paracoccaceae bacterium GXU_MW_L88]